MLFYFFISLLLFLFLYYSNRVINIGVCKINFTDIGFLLILFLSLLRFDVGWDYAGYYNTVVEDNIYLIRRFEPFSQIFFNIAVFFDSPQLVFILFGVPTYFFIYQTIKKYSPSPRFSLLLYFCFFYLESFGFIRQALSVSICFWSIRFIFERKFFRFLFYVILACMFHLSAVVALLAYPLYRKMSLFHLLWIIPLLFAVKHTLFMFLADWGLYDSYLDELNAMEGGALIRFFYILLFISLLLLRNKRLGEKEHFFFFTVGLALSFPFLFGSHLGVRLSSYFFIYYILLIPALLKNIKLKCLYALAAFAFFMLTLFMTSKDPIKSQYIPYQFIFEVGDNPIFREAK